MGVPRLLVARLLPLALLAGCTSPLLDAPEKVRHQKLLAPGWSPLLSWSESQDGSSWSWSSLFWLVGADAEGDRGTSRVLPFWWHQREGDLSETTWAFPLYFAHTSRDTRLRFYTPLWGYREDPETRQDWFLFNIYDRAHGKTTERSRSGLFLVYDDEDHEGPRHDFTLVPVLGLAHLLKVEWGYPPQGVKVPALGRDASRRWELLNLFGFLTLAGYDDVGDRREFRLLTLFSDELLSPIRSWRGRGDDPFVSEWVFPLYVNRQDESGGWFYLGPLWGRIMDTAAERQTDWWLLGAFSHTSAPEGSTWKLFGITLSGP